MAKFVQNLIFSALLLAFALAMIDARPPSAVVENNQELDNIEPDVDEARNGYYDLPNQAPYPNVPMDRMQMLFAQYRPTAYLRSPAWNSMNELYRMPESKRQVRYRQCYFNPISCFKK